MYVWPPRLTFTRMQQSSRPRDWCSGFFFHIRTVQTVPVLLAAGPVSPAGPVLAGLGCSCLADEVRDFFPAHKNALVAATMQPGTALAPLLTKAQAAAHWNPSPTPAPPSQCETWWITILSSLQPLDLWFCNIQSYPPIPSSLQTGRRSSPHKAAVHSPHPVWAAHCSLLKDSMDTGTWSSPRTRKIPLFQSPVRVSGRLTPNQTRRIHDLQQWQDLHE